MINHTDAARCELVQDPGGPDYQLSDCMEALVP
jgi:hypothetical protein